MKTLSTYRLMTLADHEEVQFLAHISQRSWQAAEELDFARAENLGCEWRLRHERLFQLLHQRSCERGRKRLYYECEVDRHTLTNMAGGKEAFLLSRVLHAAKEAAKP